MKTSARFRTDLFRSLLRGLKAFRIEKIAKKFALLDPLQIFAEFSHGLDPERPFAAGPMNRRSAPESGPGRRYGRLRQERPFRKQAANATVRARSRLTNFRPALSLRQFLQQRLGIFQVQRVETFGEQVEDRHEEVMSRCTPDPARARGRSAGGGVGPIGQDAVRIHFPGRY